MEDYKKKYEEALERAKFYCGRGKDLEFDAPDIASDIFPELKESENLKIKRDIQYAVRCAYGDNSNNTNSILAWLEKQGGITKLSEEEQNRVAKGVLSGCALSFINYLDAHAYEGKMCVSNGECKDIENAFHNAMWDRLHRYYCKYIEKQGEQKPNFCHHEVDLSNCSEEYRKAYYDGWNNCNQQYAQLKAEQKPTWCDEDERMLHEISQCIYDNVVNIGTVNKVKYIDWLKSLKERYTWKPSEEQIEALKEVADKYWEPDGLEPLYTLYQDLKKLKEE